MVLSLSSISTPCIEDDLNVTEVVRLCHATLDLQPEVVQLEKTSGDLSYHALAFVGTLIDRTLDDLHFVLRFSTKNKSEGWFRRAAFP